jgi:hypothetical protein
MLSLLTAVVLSIITVVNAPSPQPQPAGDSGQCAAPVVADTSTGTVSDPCAAPADTISPTPAPGRLIVARRR